MGQDSSDSNADSNKKTLKELVNEIPFHIVFKGTPQTRTTSVSSADLAGAADPDTEMYDITLATVRKCGKLSKTYVFCIDDTNTAEDTTSLGYYISLIKDNVTAFQKASADSSSSVIVSVLYTSKHSRPDQKTQPPTLPTSTGADDTSTGVDAGNKTATVGRVDTTGMVAAGWETILSTHPAEMNEKEWNYVMITNSLLHGLVFNGASFTLQKAREPAFMLKKSFPDPFQSPAGTTADDGSDEDSEETDDQLFCIPAFQVDDESSVTITEVKSTLQLSMARHAFSSWSVELAASGGVDGITAGASAGGGSSTSNSSASNQGQAMDCLHASYNFPRVKVFLDSDDLEISADCQTLLDTIKTNNKPEDVATFRRKYGHIFACSVQLGGRLHTTRESSAFTETDVNAKKDALKVAAGVNFSSPFGSASGSFSYAKNNNSQSTDTSDKSSESLTWEAQGGETLVGSNPAVWITSVGSFYNWRVIERGDVRNILALLKEISNDDWPTIFGNIDSTQSSTGSTNTDNSSTDNSSTDNSSSTSTTTHRIGMGG